MLIFKLRGLRSTCNPNQSVQHSLAGASCTFWVVVVVVVVVEVVVVVVVVVVIVLAEAVVVNGFVSAAMQSAMRR